MILAELTNQWGLFAIAVITAGMPGVLAWMQTKKTHNLVNSRMTELLAIAKENEKAKGVIEGRAEGKAEALAIPAPKVEG